MQSFIMNSHEVFIHIHQGCFAGTGAIVRLPQCQWSKPDGYGKISQCITTTKHSKAKTVCIFLGIYCMSMGLYCTYHYHWCDISDVIIDMTMLWLHDIQFVMSFRLHILYVFGHMHSHGVFRIFHSGCQLAGDNFTKSYLKGHIWFMTGMSYTIHFIQKVMKVERWCTFHPNEMLLNRSYCLFWWYEI